MNKEAKNMEALYKAKEDHNANCPFGGKAVRIYMTFFDIERMGWEEGDDIAGMTLHSDGSVPAGRFRIECDAEPKKNDELDIVVELENEELVPA